MWIRSKACCFLEVPVCRKVVRMFIVGNAIYKGVYPLYKAPDRGDVLVIHLPERPWIEEFSQFDH